MIERGYGRIINISSISGIVGMLDHAPYVATKGALNALTLDLAMEWGPHGITVNAIAPTVVLTAMGERVWGPPEKGDPMKAKIPIGRFGKPREIAAACVYLASEAAGLCNGHVWCWTAAIPPRNRNGLGSARCARSTPLWCSGLRAEVAVAFAVRCQRRWLRR